jgi:superfamily II DNA helicase RecQ
VVHVETGGGKTLIYHINTLLASDKITLVVIPLNSLKAEAADRAGNVLHLVLASAVLAPSTIY